jgi:hypothetical protein
VATSLELLPHGGTRKERSAEQIAAAAPLGLDYPATQVGVVGNITVSYDPALGAQGLALAQQMLTSVAGPYTEMQEFFGIAGGAVNVVIAPLSGNNDGSGGAYHYGCDFTSGGVLYLDATFASTTVNPLHLEVGLYVAELSESFMGSQNLGWGCGFSNGEGLSRFCAERETPAGTLNAFVTGPAWAQAGFPDWVTQTEQTDRDSVSTGCAIVYIYWMRSLGHTVPQIVQAGGATLQANYQRLTGKTTAYQDLRAALGGLTVTTDNPFGIEKTISIAVASWGANRLDIFGLGTNNEMFHKAWNGSAWLPSPAGWEALGGVFDSPPAVASWGPNRLDIFGLGTNNEMFHKAWNGSAWLPSATGWEALGGKFDSPPAVASWSANRLDIFGLGTDNQMYHKYWNGSAWGPSPTGWEALGGIFNPAPAPAFPR